MFRGIVAAGLIVGLWGSLEASRQLPIARFRVEDQFTITAVSADAKDIRLWLELPREDEAQKIEDLWVNSPVDWRIEKDKTTGNRFLYIQTKNAKSFPLQVVVSFELERKALALNDKSGRFVLEKMKNYLKPLPPQIPVDGKTKKLALEITGSEKETLAKARKIYDYIWANAVYYKREPEKLKPSGEGSALYCLSQKTGNCTDFHALFMSLGRSVGVPVEFVMGSWLAKEKEGKEDPKYHCWAKFFDQERGWVAIDVAFGNLWPQKKEFYFGNLDSERVAFTEGRHINLAPRQKGPALNYFVFGYLEVDGKSQGKIKRDLRYWSL
ncbi:MAG: transglutaminase domain-containing protein [Elusimicrobia bacterium]|nr:transglutaminase domain-containing protein [Elusimicrobiota bacterium]